MNHRNKGFTLIEIAMVLVILGYLLRQFVLPYAAGYEQTQRLQTLARLESIAEALQGFAIARHRFPCPAGEHTRGVALEACASTQAVGFVPGVTLGLRGPVDSKGRLTDSWGHPIVYAVSASDSKNEGVPGQPDFTTAGEMGRVGLSALRSDIVVCSDVRAGQCARNRVRANQVPFILVSHGADATPSGQQAHNQDGDALFVSSPYRQISGNKPGFDDIVVWLSESQLIYFLVQAGTLP